MNTLPSFITARGPHPHALSLAGAAPRRFPPGARSGRRRFLSSLFEDLSYRRDTGIADRRISQIRLELTSHRNLKRWIARRELLVDDSQIAVKFVRRFGPARQHRFHQL